MSAINVNSHYITTSYMQLIRSQLHLPNAHQRFYAITALHTIQLDGSLDSLHRIDQFITAFKRKFGPISANFMQSADKLNTILLLSSHIGEIICRELNFKEKWFSFEQALTDDLKVDDNFPDPEYCFALHCNGRYIFPIAYIFKHFTKDDLDSTLQDEILSLILNERIQHANKNSDYTREMLDLQMLYQYALPLYCGNIFEKLIQITQLDYSLKSLDRLDDMLREIRQNHLFTSDIFEKELKNRYFIQYIAGYIGQIIAQESDHTIRWYHPDQITTEFSEYVPYKLTTSRIALIDQTFLFIMQHVHDFLFPKTIPQSTRSYVNDAIQRIQNPSYDVEIIDNTMNKNLFLNKKMIKPLKQEL